MSNIRKTFIALIALALLATPIAVYAGQSVNMVMDGNAIITAKSPDGHFFVPVFINGKRIVLQIDTGAGDVVLNQEDAMLLGATSISTTRSFITGNGKITINGTKANVQVGNIMYTNVNVFLNTGWTGRSVMGMSMLSQFSMVKFNKNGIRLEP